MGAFVAVAFSSLLAVASEEELESFGVWRCDIIDADHAGQRVLIRLDDTGHVTIRIADEWRSVTLDELQVHLRDRVRACNAARNAAGGGDACRRPKPAELLLEIDAHPSVPWRHVGWAILVGTESKLFRFRLTVGERIVQLAPRPDSSHPLEPIAKADCAKVHLKSECETDAKWNGAAVRKPTTVSYMIGDRPSGAISSVDAYLKTVLKDKDEMAKQRFVGVITADGTVPIERVMEVLQIATRAGVRTLDFGSMVSPLPRASDRVSSVLRYPEKGVD